MKRNKLRSVLAAGACTLALGSGGIPVFAQTSAVGNGTDCRMATYMVMQNDANVPNRTIHYTVSPGKAFAGDDASMPVYAGVGTPTIADVSFSVSDTASTIAEQGSSDSVDFATKDATDEKYVKKESVIDFSSAAFPEPGIYRYIVTQTTPEDANILQDTHTKFLDVYVVTDTDGKTLKIAAYILYDADENGNPLTISRTAAEGWKVAAKTQGFTDTYVTSGNPSDGTKGSGGEEPMSSNNGLRVGVSTTGNQASHDKYFAVRIDVQPGSGTEINDADLFTIAQDSSYDRAPEENPATAYPKTEMAANGIDASADLAGIQISGKDLKAGYTFYLRDGQSLDLRALPAGAAYTVQETPEDYTPTNTVTAPAVKESDSRTTGTVSTDRKLGAGSTAFSNDRHGAIPTGVALSMAPYLLAGAGAAAAGTVIAVRKKRNRKKEESGE